MKKLLSYGLVCVSTILSFGCTYQVVLQDVKVERTQDKILVTFETDTDMFEFDGHGKFFAYFQFWVSETRTPLNVDINERPYTHGEFVSFSYPEPHDLKQVSTLKGKHLYSCQFPLQYKYDGPDAAKGAAKVGEYGYNLTKAGNYQLYFWIAGYAYVFPQYLGSNVVVVDFVVPVKLKQELEQEKKEQKNSERK